MVKNRVGKNMASAQRRGKSQPVVVDICFSCSFGEFYMGKGVLAEKRGARQEFT